MAQSGFHNFYGKNWVLWLNQSAWLNTQTLANLVQPCFVTVADRWVSVWRINGVTHQWCDASMVWRINGETHQWCDASMVRRINGVTHQWWKINNSICSKIFTILQILYSTCTILSVWFFKLFSSCQKRCSSCGDYSGRCHSAYVYL